MPGLLRLHYAPDNASLCVRLALLQLNQPFETVLVDRRQAAQRDPAYLALNPNGLIPTLETPVGPLFETGAILLWLADQHPSDLFPAQSDALRGRAVTWLFWLSNTLHPLLRMQFYPHLYTTDEGAMQTHARLTESLNVLEQAADVLELAPLLQCYAMPMLRWAALYGRDQSWFDLQRSPRLAQIAQVFEETPHAVTAAKIEGLGPTPFSAPSYPNPPEGSAL